MNLDYKAVRCRMWVYALCCMAAIHTKSAFGSSLLDRVTGAVDDRIIQLDITEDGVPDRTQPSMPSASIPWRHLQISCLRNCAPSIHFSEAFSDAPISAFRIDDLSADFITIWEAGSAYIVRIYRISGDRVEKVFDQPTRTFPQFLQINGGALGIILNSEGMRLPIKAGAEADIWRLTDGKYRKTP